jgi:transcription elongation factor Elf1
VTPLHVSFQCPDCGQVSCEPMQATVLKLAQRWWLRLDCPVCGERCDHVFPLSKDEATGWLDQGANRADGWTDLDLVRHIADIRQPAGGRLV